MKKTLFLLVAILSMTFMSCSDDESAQYAKYKFSYLAVDGGEKGIQVDIILHEYNDKGEKIDTKAISNCTTGFSEEYTANSETRKVKVSMTMSKEYLHLTKWAQKTWYLKSGEVTNIVMDNNVVLGPDEP